MSVAQLFADADFMIFSAGVLENRRGATGSTGGAFREQDLDFAKQLVIERSTGAIAGYSGVD